MNAVLVLAKEGSIGLPGKNIRKVKDRRLLEWLIVDAKKSKTVDKIFVSTNGEETAEIAKAAGAEVIMRSNELAKNENFMGAVNHAAAYMKDKYANLENIILAECVTPFREPGIFDKCFSFLADNPEYDSIVTIRRLGYIAEALMKIDNDELVPYFPEKQPKVPISRQESQSYEIDHAVECFRYSSWLKRDEGINPWSYLGKKIKGIEQSYHNPNCFVDVHELNDVKWLEFIVEHLGFEGMKACD